MLQRTTIGIFGPRNAGKSSLVNLLAGQQVSIVSDVAGTTTDPVSKPIEINGLGSCVFIDTAGYDDEGQLGQMRVTKTKQVISRCDIAIFLLPSTATTAMVAEARRWYQLIAERCTQTLLVINQFQEKLHSSFQSEFERLFKDVTPYIYNVYDYASRQPILDALGMVHSRIADDLTIVTHLVQPADVVVLVMPQDIQAPSGRLILPQVQTIRELLDYRCTVVSCTTCTFQSTLAALSSSPSLIVTDSQAFAEVYRQKPEGVRLTSFSVLFARRKGDIDTFVYGADAISRLTSHSRVLIAEACTHAPLAEDIGREKIPALLRKIAGQELTVDVVSGNDWPDDLARYDLVIHCGACMLGRKQVLSRLADLNTVRIPVTNYGVAIAYINGILDKIVY